MGQDSNKKNTFNGVTFFTENRIFMKKENRYLLKILGLSVLLFVGIDGSGRPISYFLSLISSVLIINGYNKVKKENSQNN